MVSVRRDAASDYVVQETTQRDVRILAVIHGPSAPSVYRFPLDLPLGSRLDLIPTGEIAVVNEEGEGVALITAPWGKDASGKAVPTRYAVEGNVIVMHVDHGQATYPVVADPRFTSNCGIATCSLYLSRSTTRGLWRRLEPYQNSSNAAIAAAAAAACFPLGGWPAVLCGGAAGVAGGFGIDKIGQAARANQCLRIRYARGVNVPNGVYVDRSRYCKN
jgi:hypothetical protein